MRHSRRLLLATGLLLCGGAQDHAQVDPDFTGLVNEGARWAADALSAGLPVSVGLPSARDLQAFLVQLQAQLQSGSVEDLADWTPYVEAGAKMLSQVEGGRDYASWLLQRLDYFEMAAAALAEGSPQTAPRPPVLALKPPAKRSGPGPTPEARLKRNRYIGNVSVWKQRLKTRQAPPQSASLVRRIKAVFRDEGVPPELVWIAEVESSMNPLARNPVGAVGLFQFMPATARRFDLRTSPIDDREDPAKASRAAARYLRFLYWKFNSWPLAVAAYNAGEGRVGGLLEGSRTKSYDAIADDLPAETRMYVPKVTAVVNLREGIESLDLPAPSLRACITIERLMAWKPPIEGSIDPDDHDCWN